MQRSRVFQTSKAVIHACEEVLCTQGIRRVVAVTGQEAVQAIDLAEQLSIRLIALDQVKGATLEKEATAIKQASPLHYTIYMASTGSWHFE